MIASSPPPLLRAALAAAVALAVAVPAGLAGQTAAGAGSTERLTLALSAIAPDRPVRVTTATYQLEDALVGGLGDAAVTLRNDDLSVDIPFADIRAVAVRDSHWLQGMLWGGTTGAVLGSVVGVMVGSWGCSTPVGCQDDENAGAVTWGLIGGAVGGIGGFVIGRYSFYWRPVFP